MNTEGKYIANKRVKHPYSWAKTTVYQILSNPVYLGKLVSQLLLGDIQKHAALTAADHDAYVEHLVQLSERESNGERISQQKEADTLLQHIYEDHVFGQLSDERYAAMSANYEAETVKLKTRCTEIQKKLSPCYHRAYTL